MYLWLLLGAAGLVMFAMGHKGGTPGLSTPGVWDGVSDEDKRMATSIMQQLGVDPNTGNLIPGLKVDPNIIRTAYVMVVKLRDSGHTNAATVIENYANSRNAEYMGGGVTLFTPGIWDGMSDTDKKNATLVMQYLGVDPSTGNLIPGAKVSPDIIRQSYSFVVNLRNSGFSKAAALIENYANTRNAEYMSGGAKV